MFIILLSGGSGKRLWPLSTEIVSKQYVQFLNCEYTESKEKFSMLQRIYKQLSLLEISENTVIATGKNQTGYIKEQLGDDVKISVEPCSRDTLPAILLACGYIKTKCNACLDDYVAIIPVDAYTELEFYITVQKLEVLLKEVDAKIGLIGIKPDAPTSKYGYVIPGERYWSDKTKTTYYKIEKFKEKPNEENAQKYINQGGLWNCGVICMKLGHVNELLTNYEAKFDYDWILENYNKIPSCSFDYAVLEKCNDFIAVEYDGIWSDIGTWDTIIGKTLMNTNEKMTILEESNNTSVINKIGVPILVLGANDLIITATENGILVSNKKNINQIKNFSDRLSTMLAE